jgi:hypothetical protein
LTDFTGYATASQVTGKVYAADTPTSVNLTTAVQSMLTAYTDAAGRPSPFLNLGAGNIGGQTLTPGLYKWGSRLRYPNITISGSADDVWIFQISGDLTTSATRVTLQGGAKASNIFWQVAGKATFGTTLILKGLFCQ